MLGSMGLTIPIALGVAIAQPQRHVIALEGDGSLLMQLGCLATVAERAPKNLTIRWCGTTASTRSPVRSRRLALASATWWTIARAAGIAPKRLGR
jgi:thiamine pyrophosphate-dependent acetolactate synthase large subunit-like protein